MTDVGDLRHRLTLEKLSRAADGGGGYTETWVTVATIWGQLIPKTGRETLLAEKPTSRVIYDIIIRYRDDMTVEMRFSDGAQLFYIESFFDEDGRQAYLTCKCERRDS